MNFKLVYQFAIEHERLMNWKINHDMFTVLNCLFYFDLLVKLNLGPEVESNERWQRLFVSILSCFVRDTTKVSPSRARAPNWLKNEQNEDPADTTHAQIPLFSRRMVENTIVVKQSIKVLN